MASILKVDTIQDQDGNNIINESGDTITIGASGDTITVPTGASLTVPSGGLTGQNYPAFDAYLSADQTGLTDQAYNLVKFDSTYFDTDNAFDTTDGQNKFTVPSGKAGKYCFYAGILANPNADNQTEEAIIAIYKNGVIFRQSWYHGNTTSRIRYAPITLTTAMDLAESDYIQLYFYGYDTNSAHKLEDTDTFFGAFRIGD